MQTSKDELKAQQTVMAFLGFYKGPIDGIWSMDSISAKRRFEEDDLFLPCYPNNGLPFTARQKLPANLYWKADGKLSHRDLTEDKEREIVERQQKVKVEAENHAEE